MKKFSCPSCGAEVIFQSASSVFSICKFCRSTLVRKDLNLESIGKMADLQEDASPLQIGTSGKWKGNFLILGRVKVAWDDGFWNEWFIRFDDGREGWLAEAQGFYMLSFPVEKPSTLPPASKMMPGLSVVIQKTSYAVDDIKNVTYVFAEGELPFVAPQGFKGISVDLSEGEENFASVSFAGDADPDVFVGQYIEFDQFHFQNLRAVDGW